MDLEDLEVYRLAEDLVITVYNKTRNFPREEVYGLTSQLRRAAISVLANIAEAWGRYHYKDRVQFLYSSRGSLIEVWSLFKISNKLGYWKPDDDFEHSVKNLRVKLNNFIGSLKEKP